MRSYFILPLLLLPMAACQSTSSDGVPYVRDQSRTVALASDQAVLRLNHYRSLERDCKDAGRPSIKIVSAGLKGRVEARQEQEFSSYPADNPRSVCNQRKHPTTVVYYTRPRGFTGTDSVVYEIQWRDGLLWRQSYTIQVR